MANSVESTARHDAQALKHGGDKGDNSKALQLVADHAHSMSTKDLKSEQHYWNSLGKASHDHLPGLSIHRNNDGNVDSVKNAAGESMYDRNAEIKKTVESNSATLKNGQGPFDAFKAAGLSDREASANAKKIMEGTGRQTFHAGEKLGVQSDSVTTSSTDKKTGISTEEKYNNDRSGDKAHETKVTQKDGVTSETTFTNKDGVKTGSMEHKVNGTVTSDTTRDAGGRITETNSIDSSTGETTNVKKQKDSDRTAEKTVTHSDNSSTKTTYGADGVTRTESIDTDKNGLKTQTKFEADGRTPQTKHQEKADGFTDTQFKNGKIVKTTDHTNGKNGSYDETETTAKTPQGNDERVSQRHRDETAADGTFKYTEHNKQGSYTESYDMKFNQDGTKAEGTRTRSAGGRGGSHTVPEFYYNGAYSEKAPAPKPAG